MSRPGKCRLSRSVGADDAHPLAFFDGQVDIFERQELLIFPFCKAFDEGGFFVVDGIFLCDVGELYGDV